MPVIKDFWNAVKHFGRHPGIAAVALVTLGVAMGMAVAVWSVVDAVLLAPLPYPEAERLVQLSMSEPDRGALRLPMSALNYRDFAERCHSFQAVAATFRENLNITGADAAERVAGVWVSAPFFDIMGVPLELGRGFHAAEDSPDGDPVAVISHGLWQRRFAGSPDVLGARLVVNGRSREVVGVAPAGFSFPDDTEMWVPIAVDWAEESRAHGWVVPVARLARGVELDEARADVDRVAALIETMYPDENRDRGARVTPLRDTVVGEVRPSLYLLSVAVICVLLIAAANVGILLSVHAAARQRETALRRALGGRRAQLVRQLVIEAMVLAAGGAVIAVLLARGLVAAAGRHAVELMPRGDEIAIDLGSLACALVLAVITGLMVGAVPALKAREAHIMSHLKESAAGVIGGGAWMGRTLVGAEIALTMILLAGAMLLIRSFVNLNRVDPGFDTSDVITAELALSGDRYAEDAQRVDFFSRALEEVAALPGVKSVGTVYPLPLHGRRVSTSVAVEGVAFETSPGRQPLVDLRFVSPGYRSASGLRLVAGRFIAESDVAGAPEVVVVNESFVRSLMPPGDPVGRRVTADDPSNPEAEWQTVVGVVKDVCHIDLAQGAGAEMYLPVAQYPFEWASFVVRVDSGLAAAMGEPLQAAIRRVDPGLPLFNVQPFSAVVQRSLGDARLLTSLLTLFAATGLGLAGVGVFSVVSFSVGRRTREMAIRLALGGSPAAVRGLVVRQGLEPVVVGAAAGLVVGAIAVRLLASKLYGVSVHDPAALAAGVLLILMVAFAASWLPARRATRLHPMLLLRSE